MIYTCIQKASASIVWEKGNLLSKAGLKASANDSPDNPIKLTFITQKTGGILKGNIDQSELKRINDYVYLEVSMTGNVFLWTLIPKKDHIPTYLFQHKAYDLFGPFSITVAYECE